MMFLREIYDDRVVETMNNILSTGGEEALKKLPETHPAVKMYLKIRLKERAVEMKEHAKVREKFQRLKNGK
jgi:hypothetical protein